MSLTSHLKDWKQSPIGQFLREHFPQTASIAKEANSRLHSASTIRPTDQPVPYGTLGTAIDYRIRYSFALTPSEEFTIAREAAASLSFRPWTSDDDIPVDPQDIPVNMGFPFNPFNGTAQGPYAWKTFTSFFSNLDAVLAEIHPVGQRLESEAEQLLARYCYVLALLEAVGRTGIVQQGPLVIPSPKKSADELLTLPRDAWIEDLRNMSWLFYDQCHDLLSLPHVLNPVFAGSNDVGGADADLIVDGCLIELKASIDPKIKPDWLWQLAGYLLLDYDDIYHMRSLGIYMARQGMRFQWSVEEFIGLLTANPQDSLESLRHEFRSRFEQRPTQYATGIISRNPLQRVSKRSAQKIRPELPPLVEHNMVSAYKRLVLIDGNAIIHRAYYSVPETLATKKGEVVNATFGFTSLLIKALKEIKPDYITVAFDCQVPTFRHQRLATYKTHRPTLPENIHQQFERIREIIEAFSVPMYAKDDFEADDILGTLARQATELGLDTIILTGDMDTLQLVDEHVSVIAMKKGITEATRYSVEEVQEHFGVPPAHVPDYKGLVGDTSDNIPGVTGVDEKLAKKLLAEYGGEIEQIFAHIDDLAPKEQRLLRGKEEVARQSKDLATIVRNVPVQLDLDACRVDQINQKRAVALLRKLEFRTLIDKITSL